MKQAIMSIPRFTTIVFLLAATAAASVLERKYEDDEDSIFVEAKNVPDEEIITYEGAQVWRIPEDKEKTEFLHYLQDKGGWL